MTVRLRPEERGRGQQEGVQHPDLIGGEEDQQLAPGAGGERGGGEHMLQWRGDDIRSARNKTKQHILQFFFTFSISQSLFPVFFAVSSKWECVT